MKFCMLPQPWDETVTALNEAGHEEVELGRADFLVFNGSPEDFPEDLPQGIGFVQVPFAGIDHLIDVIRDTDVRWSNAAGVYDRTVAESALALLLAQLHDHKRMALAQSWSARAEAEAHTEFLFEDKTVAVLGAGGIGRRLIEMLEALGPKVIAVNRSGRPVDGADETLAMSDVTVENLWGKADCFALLLPLTDETNHIIDAEKLHQMKESAIVVNVGRGPLIDTDALVDALRSGEISGAALDVTDPEPLPDGHPLWGMANCTITPHLANPPYSVRKRIGKHTARVAAAYEKGEKLPTEVDVTAGY